MLSTNTVTNTTGNQATTTASSNAELNAQGLTGTELAEKSRHLRAQMVKTSNQAKAAASATASATASSNAELNAQALTGEEVHRKSQSRQLFSAGVPDAIGLVNQLLDQFITTATDTASAKAKEVETKSKAIAEITRLWSLSKTEFSKHVNPSDPDRLVTFADLNEATKQQLRQIDEIIKTDLANPQGIAEITGVNINLTLTTLRLNYSAVESMSATATAFTDKIQVTLDTLQQEFKNEMTDITSANEEVRSLAQFKVQISQQS